MPVFVVSPAADGSVVEEGAGVSVACGDCGGGASVGEGDGVAWCVPSLVTVVAELSVFVVSPAADGSVVEEGAGVSVACGDCGGGASVGEGDGVAWCVPSLVTVVAELTVLVVSPASNRAGIR